MLKKITNTIQKCLRYDIGLNAIFFFIILHACIDCPNVSSYNNSAYHESGLKPSESSKASLNKKLHSKLLLLCQKTS